MTCQVLFFTVYIQHMNLMILFLSRVNIMRRVISLLRLFEIVSMLTFVAMMYVKIIKTT